MKANIAISASIKKQIMKSVQLWIFISSLGMDFAMRKGTLEK